MNLLDLFVKVGYDDKDVEKGIDGTSKKGKTFGEKLGGAFGGVAKVVGAISTAAIALGTVFVKGAMDTANYGSRINDMSQKLNISTKAYQELDYMLGQVGGNVDGLQMGLKTLAKAAVDGSDSFKTLGISQKELSTLSTEDLFNRTIDELSKMEAGNERTALAADLFGRSSADLMPLLNSGADGIQKMREEAEKYGLIMSDEAVAASDAFGDSVSLMQQTLTGMKNRLMGEFLPSLTLVTDGLALLFTGDTSGLDGINKGIGEFVKKISEAMPQVMAVGGSILQALATAIMTNMPTLVQTAFDVLSQFAMYILENLPMLLETSLQILNALALGIAEQAPVLIPAIIETIITMINTLIENVPMLVQGAIALMNGLAQGILAALPLLIQAAPQIILSLINAIVANLPTLLASSADIIVAIVNGVIAAIPQLVAAVPQIVMALVKAFAALAPQIWNIGKNIVQGIWNGISGSLTWIKNKISGWVGDVLAFIKKLFGIKSPSTVMRDEVGKFLAYGVGDGITDNLGYVKKSMLGMMDMVMGMNGANIAMTGTLAAESASTGGTRGALGLGGMSNVFNFYDAVKSPVQTSNRITTELAGLIYG